MNSAQGHDIRTGFAHADDGVELYYRSVGAGPAIVCCNGVGVSTFFFKYIVEHFRHRFQVVVWDYRGHGLSGLPANPSTTDLSVHRSASDLKAVLHHLDIQSPVVLAGHSMGVQVILEFAAHNPSRVRALIPLFGTYRRPLDTLFDTRLSLFVFKIAFRMAAVFGQTGTRMLLPLYANPMSFDIGRKTGMFDRYYAQRHDMDKYMEHLVHMDPRVFLNMLETISEHDLSDALRDIQAPTLVFAGERDLFTPVHCSRTMVSMLPNAELLVLPDASHAAIVEQPETINARVDQFFEHHGITTSG